MLSIFVDVEQNRRDELNLLYNSYDWHKKDKISVLSVMISKTIKNQCIISLDISSKGILCNDFKSLILKEYEGYIFDPEDVLLEISLLKVNGYLVHRYSHASHIKGLDAKG